MVTVNVTGVSVQEFKDSSGVGTVTDRFGPTDFNVEVDERDAYQLVEWVEDHGGEARVQ